MQIKKAAEAAGLTERAIRLYEERGLISPVHIDKNGRDFRDYSDEDVRKLRTIASLRRALFTIEEIKEMTDSPDAIPSVVASHRERMHTDFENLSYLVDQLDRVSTLTVTSTDTLANAIFASTSHANASVREPTEEEKLLFSEQYKQIYEKYFSENTGWERRYDASLRAQNAVRNIFSRKTCIILAAILLFSSVLFLATGIARTERLPEELRGVEFFIDDPESKKPFTLRIDGVTSHRFLKPDTFKAMIYLDGYNIYDGYDRLTGSGGFKIEHTVTEACEPYDIRMVPVHKAVTADGDPCTVYVYLSFDEDGELYGIVIIEEVKKQSRPGSYIWDAVTKRAICVSPEGESSALEMYSRVLIPNQ